MSTSDLQQARRELEEAVSTADDGVRDPVRDTAAAFADLASGEREADHAVFDDHLNTLRQARREADGETADRIDRALDRAEAYRQELDQSWEVG